MKYALYTLFLTTLLSSTAAAATFSLALENSDLLAAPGTTVTFSASAESPGVVEDLNSVSYTVASPLTMNAADFFNFWPLALSPNTPFGPQALFSVTVPTGTAQGNYTGSFGILGGSTSTDQNLLGSVDFTVTVTPEPATMAMFGLTLPALFIVRRRGRWHFQHNCND